MRVKPSQDPNLPPVAVKKKKGFFSKLGKKISKAWKNCFSGESSVAVKVEAPVKLPPVKKVHLFDEAVSAIVHMKTLLIPEPLTPVPEVILPAPMGKQPPAPKKPPVGYKAVNPIVLKDFPNVKINIVHGDLFESKADVIVNAANKGLGGGGGIDGAIHAAGKDSGYAAKHKALKTQKPDFTEGDALIIEGVVLKSNKRDPVTRKPTAEIFNTTKDVIVVAGPNRQTAEKDAHGVDKKIGIIGNNKQLYDCYYNALQLAHDKGKKSIAFPAISVGIFAYPKDEAAKVSLQAISDFIKSHPDTKLTSIDIHSFDPGKLDYDQEFKDWQYYQGAINKNTDFIPTSNPGKVAAPVRRQPTADEINQKRMQERTDACTELAALAQVLKGRLTETPNTVPRMHKNFAQTCWMNSSLQSLGNSYINTQILRDLISQDLSLNENDSYDALELRLASFAPIPVEELDLDQLQASKQELEDKIKGENTIADSVELKTQLHFVNEKIKNATELLGCIQERDLYEKEYNACDDEARKEVIINKAINLNQRIAFRDDRILFKWSFLLYMQACRYGEDKDVEAALKAHHRVCFAIGRHPDFNGMPSVHNVREPHEISTYMQLWHEMLGLGLNSSFYKAYDHEGKTVIAGHNAVIEGVIDVTIDDKSTLIEGLEKTFKSSVDTELNVDGVIIPAGQATDEKKIHGQPPKVITLNVNGERRQTPLQYDKDKKDKQHYRSVLDLSPYFAEKTSAKYKIIGLTIHKGDHKHGHYYSYARVKKEDGTLQWYECNDMSITPVDTKNVPFDKATTLTYYKTG